MGRIKRLTLSVFFVLGILLGIPNANAVGVVDTGEPPAPPAGFAWAFDQNFWFSGRFTTAQNYTITSLEGWLWEGNDGLANLLTGSAEVVIYGDGGNTPNTADEIFRQIFTIPNNDPDGAPIDVPGVNPYNWHGATGINLPLAAGTYWIAFEVIPAHYPASWYDGAIGATAPNALANEAYAQSFDGIYHSLDAGIGVRILGEAGQVPQNGAAIPEPSSLLMLAAGFIGLSGLRRRLR